MESSRKRLGLIKRKLVKSYRAAAVASKPIQHEEFVANQVMDRPSTIHHLHQNQNHQPIKQKLVPYNPNSTTFSSSSTTSAAVDFILNQEQVTVPQKPKTSFYVPPGQSTHDREYSNSSTATTYYAKTTLDNESIDLKAASYISSVQERFRLENSERKAQCF
ncbi:hypothetical protein AABB24_023929 [Solanum stoloniferum]|uniref:Uncharacterized protein n=1 Tax=Solanum stoloniferum TaxID=62892 RepID=A0ABD2SLN2_9SOLN